jgi:class 3 adenylate cyclase
MLGVVDGRSYAAMATFKNPMNSLQRMLSSAIQNGVHLFDDEFARKRRKTQNMVMLAINFANMFVVFYILALIALIGYLHAQKLLDLHKAITSIVGYSIVVAIGGSYNLYVLRWHKKTASIYPFVSCLIVNIIYIFIYSIFLEPETFFFLYLFTTIPVIYLTLGSERQIRWVLFLAISCALVAIGYQSWLGPLLPIKTPFLTETKPILYYIVIYITKSFGIITNIMFLVGILSNGHHYTQQTEADLQTEKEKSETLLRNILPEQIIQELKNKGANTPVRFESATVVFTDFVGFTAIAEKWSAEDLVAELDKCFTYFDQVTEKYGLEKLKTIGDAFMCAGGLPTPNRTHAIDCCLAALEIQSFMNQMKEIKEAQNEPYWTLRLGINTGPLVAGVVGTRKFAYDVWGDTVNTAARLESSGVPGRINISSTTFEQVAEFFECEHRGKVEAKSKGQIDMYFLSGIKPKFSVSGSGRVPNKEFRLRLQALDKPGVV